MADPRVNAVTTGKHGRFLMSVRQNHFVADATVKSSGPGEAPGAAEWLLTSLCSCALALIVQAAQNRADPMDRAELDATYTSDAEDVTRIKRIVLHLRVTGVDQAAADALLLAFTSRCPIWNTVARTTPCEATAEAVPTALARAA